MANNDPSVRQILPHEAQNAQSSQMGSFSTFAPQQFPQRETQKNYVFVDEHNRHKRLKVMRACEGCRRRKIKCDAATTNTWPCSACIRLKLQCVRPNGFDGAADPNGFEMIDPSQFQQMPMSQQGMMQGQQKQDQAIYAMQGAYNDAAYQSLPYDASQTQHDVHYTTISPPPGMMEQQQSAGGQNVFPTPPMQHQQGGRVDESSPEAYSPDAYQQQDLADLLGTLKVDEAGTAPYLRNKASFRREEQPVVDDDDEELEALPPLPVGRGMKIRIPPELMPDDETVLHYFDLYFTHVHPYIPVLSKPMFYQQWNQNRASISPLLLEAIFAIGGRLAEDPGEGQQWLALASRHADAFMDVPRLSTLQALLMILKAREAAPKRGYYYRSWMTIVQCVQMGKDLGLDEHFDDHQIGRGCDCTLIECQLRTRIWQAIFVCEVMVGAPQGRLDLAVDLDSVDFHIPKLMPGIDEGEFHVSRNFTYFVRVVRNVRKMSRIYARLRKKKDWGIDPKFQQLNQDVHQYLSELPADLAVTFPADGSPPWLPSHVIGNIASYYYLTLLLLHRPQLSFLDPSGADGSWKQHMLVCYDAAKCLCRLQEAIVANFGLTGLQCMQRGYSFTVYAGLSCIVLHLVAIVSPDPDLNTDARQFFTRHMRIMERVMEAWHMPELQKQVDAVREAFSADTRKPFALKPSFPYGSPHPSNQSSPPRLQTGYRPGASPLDQQQQRQLEVQNYQQMNFAGHPISPPISAGPDAKSESPGVQAGGLVMMSQGSQASGMQQNMTISDAPAWNPARLFEQWNSTFGVPEVSTLQDLQAVNSTLPAGQQVSPQQFSAPSVPNFVTPAMWQESVASVYEGGLKRGWDFEGQQMMKRQ
ncbi:hypothetical protein NLU13_1126 [Sarocladium strictum]|uniref:Zn(2)-C6 fungal-type domain-containing protein n=1 Tax=Sarocladium strictum TaxID=5046 RepID=A0AA39GQL7_SARSR|nr:hypothetical protein NLU13_1126 [Sarocladium strictum]